MVGTALRFAVASGFHTHVKSSLGDLKQEEVLTKTWWSLHNLESLLSSMTGRPCMLRSEDVTAPLPSDVAEDRHPKDPINTPAISFLDAQVRLAVITQEILSHLYTKRRASRSWAQTHAIITSMMSELDEWSSEAISQHLEGAEMTPDYDLQQISLKKQYFRIKILIARPSLGRIERCSEAGTDDFTLFDQETAEACVQTAHEVASLLPDEVDLKLVYEKGPWWTIMHNSECPTFIINRNKSSYRPVMQALAVLLIGISCRQHFEFSYSNSVASVKKLVTYVQYMRDTNDTAKRAYQVIHGIIKAPDLVNPSIWVDIAGLFPDELTPHPLQTAIQGYLPLAGEEHSLQWLFGLQDGSDYGYCPIRPV